MAKNSNTKIVIVDDDKAFLEEIEELLTSTGYEVTVASDVDSALNTVLISKPNVVLLDLQMTPKSGFQLADQLINSMHIKDILLIAMSGAFLAKEHTLLMKMCGIQIFIPKPIRPLDLISKIEFEIEKKAGTHS